MPIDLCPGYFTRDDQEIIERNGPGSAEYYCAICNSPVQPVFKDGGWVPKNHTVKTDRVSFHDDGM